VFVRQVWKRIERFIFPHLKHVMTVSNLIAIQYEKEYSLKPAVIRNCSRRSEGIPSISRRDLGINNDHLLLIFQGGGINIDKGGEELIEAMRKTENVSLLIAGSGDVVPALKKKTEFMHLSDKIKFIPKMPWEDLMRYTRSADAGLCLEKDTNLNYRFSLPNKLFDYLSAGIPVITGTLPEIKKIVEENDCGIIIPAITPDNIRNAIKRLLDNHDILKKLRQNAVFAFETLCWEKESVKVIEFYREVLKH
jgi:glycosyltransferase involved in cell wall biosynthesis